MSGPLLAGRIAVVTGGAAGIGGGISRRLAAEGAHVVVNDIDGDLLAGTVDNIVGNGGVATAVPADIRTREGVDALVAAAFAVDGGRVDVLVNNVGDYRPNGRFLTTTGGRLARALRDQPRARVPRHARDRAGDGGTAEREHRERLDGRGAPRHPGQRGVLRVQRRA